MTTVSIVECRSQVPLRTCGSSQGAPLKNRRKFKAGAPQKNIGGFQPVAPAPKRSPELYRCPVVSYADYTHPQRQHDNTQPRRQQNRATTVAVVTSSPQQTSPVVTSSPQQTSPVVTSSPQQSSPVVTSSPQQTSPVPKTSTSTPTCGRAISRTNSRGISRTNSRTITKTNIGTHIGTNIGTNCITISRTISRTSNMTISKTNIGAHIGTNIGTNSRTNSRAISRTNSRTISKINIGTHIGAIVGTISRTNSRINIGTISRTNSRTKDGSNRRKNSRTNIGSNSTTSIGEISKAYSGAHIRVAADKCAGARSPSSLSACFDQSDDFSDEDLDKYITKSRDHISPEPPEPPGGQQPPKVELQIIGSKPKLHGMFENLGDLKSNAQHVTNPASEDPCDRDSSTSPDNPPPSPVNFRPSVKDFVVGGQKILSTPDKSTGSPTQNCRDFTPGFVKQRLYQCGKCEGRVLEEEQSLHVLQKRVQHIIESRASPYRHQDDDTHDPTPTQDLAPKRDCITPIILLPFASKAPPEPLSTYVISASKTSDLSCRSFLQICHEKKREKEEREGALREGKGRREQGGRERDKLARLRVRLRRTSSVVNRSSRVAPSNGDKIKTGGEKNKVIPTIKHPVAHKTSRHSVCNFNIPNTNISDLSVTTTLGGTGTPGPAYGANKQRFVPRTRSNVVAAEKCQIRRCRSDIWPFPQDFLIQSATMCDDYKTDDYITRNSSDVMLRSRTRLGPYGPLPINETLSMNGIYSQSQYRCLTESRSSLSGVSLDGQDVVGVKSDSQYGLVDVRQSGVDLILNDVEDQEVDSTMTSTVIVPERDRTCTQWITFTGDNEPVLNQAPANTNVNDGADNFLKRLQRSKVVNNSDPSLPGNSQFCFEPVVDKRYNRWKRRRRKKKDSESHRASVAQGSDSSDENEETPNGRSKAIERILDKMYEQINGSVRKTQSGTLETPRMRNRRRRENNEGERENDKSSLYGYDASSEWTNSDKDGAAVSSSSSYSTGNENKNPAGSKTSEKSNSSTDADALCSWSYLEKYKQEILRRIGETPKEHLGEVAKNDWLPDITSHRSDSIRSNSSERNSETNCVQVNESSGPPQDGAVETDRSRTVRPRDKSVSLSSPPAAPLSPTPDSVDSLADYLTSHRAQVTTPSSSKTPRNNTNKHVMSRKSLKEEDNYKPLQRTNSTKWGEIGQYSSSKQSPVTKRGDMNPEVDSTPQSTVTRWGKIGQVTGSSPSPTRPVSFIAVGGTNSETSDFMASPQPIRYNDVIHQSLMKTVKRSREAPPYKTPGVDLPMLSKDDKLQTISKLENPIINKTTKVGARLSHFPQPEPSPRPQTQPQVTAIYPGARRLTVGRDLLFRDYYLRTLYNSNAARANSNASSINTGQPKKPITVNHLDLGDRRAGRMPAVDGEDRASPTSPTRPFTFSMFDLPHMYKHYNIHIEGKANVEQIPTERRQQKS